MNAKSDPADAPPAETAGTTSKASRQEVVPLAEVLRRLDAIAKTQAQHEADVLLRLDELARYTNDLATRLSEVQAGVEAATKGFLSLQAIVVNALPSRLLRLTSDHIALLRERAPDAKVRLISPFKAGLINLAEGYVMPVSDGRVRVHGQAMNLALVVSVDTDVDVIVQRLVDDQVRELARLESNKTRAAAQVRLEETERQAAELRAQTGQ